MAYALEGIKVLDLAQHVAGPTTSMYLADQGADVIKVEAWPKGDSSRGSSTTAFLKENGRGFMVINRNKRSIVLDIRKPQGNEVLRRLVKDADVVVLNFRLAAAKRLGVDYETLSALNPRLVYATLSAFGTKGPNADKGGYDRILQGMAGVMYRRMPNGTPITAGLYAADSSTPMMLAYGIMLALWVREKTGLGQKVEGSLLQTWIALQATDLVRAEEDPEQPEERTTDVGFGVYQCADSQWINIAPNNDRQFTNACKALGLDYVLEDPRFDDPAQRTLLREEIDPEVAKVIRAGSSQDWLARFNDADVPCGPILTKSQVFDDPQIVANDMLTTVQHPKAGRTRMVTVPLKLSATPGAIRKPSPLLGEHTDEILKGVGYSSEEIDQLRAQEVL